MQSTEIGKIVNRMAKNAHDKELKEEAASLKQKWATMFSNEPIPVKKEAQLSAQSRYT